MAALQLANREESQAVYTQGEATMIALFEGQTETSMLSERHGHGQAQR